ncbi:MAG: hypothetical protein ACYC48_00605 [Minisyncoccota bacterium]
MNEKPPRRRDEDGDPSEGKYPAKRLSRKEREARRELGMAPPTETVLPEAPKLPELSAEAAPIPAPEETEEMKALPAQEAMQEVVRPVQEQEAAPIPEELAEIFGDKTPPASVVEMYAKLKGNTKRGSYLEHLKETLARKEAKKARDVEVKPPQEPESAPPKLEIEKAEEVSEPEESESQPIELGEIATSETGASEGIEDKTPKEWHEELRDTVWKIEEIEIKANPELSPGAKKAEIYNRRRLRDLDVEARETGVVEKTFRSLGERYNKYGWKTKMAVGLSLGVGAGVGAAVSMPLAFACLSGIAAQRVAGMGSMFLKYEKSSQDGKWKKEKAMGKAIVYTAGMTGAMMLLSEGVKEGIEYANQHDWLGHMLGHMLGHHVQATEMHSPAAAAAAGAHAPEAAVAAHAEMPTVGASAHGYEGMMKDLWHQLQEKHVTLPANADPHSDLARLLAADKGSLDKVVHQLAADPKHAFFHGGASVRIDSGAHMTIGNDGQLHFSDAAHADIVHAPPGMPATPVYHEAIVQRAEAPAAPVEAPAHAEPVTPPVEAVSPSTAPQAAPVHAEVVPPARGEDWYSEQSVTPTHAAAHTPHTAGHAEAPAHAEATVQPAEHPGFAPNSFGIKVPLNESHIYADTGGKHLFAFGGGAGVETQAQEYALKNHASVFVDKSYKFLGLINTPRVIEYTPDGQLVVHHGPAFVPDPKTFTKVVQ